jgi:hypothetical protein
MYFQQQFNLQLIKIPLQFCYAIDDSFSTERAHGWLYLVLFPYFVPLLAAVFPAVKLALMLRDRRRTGMLESEAAAVRKG